MREKGRGGNEEREGEKRGREGIMYVWSGEIGEREREKEEGERE